MSLNWQDHYAERIRIDSGPTLGSLLGLGPDTISLAGGLPAPEFFPLDAIQEAVTSVLASDAHGALQYGPTPGYYPLREFLADRMSAVGVTASAEQVLITTGSQQGLDLVARLLIDPGSTIVVEDPSYAGGLQAFDSCQASYLAVPIDNDGMRVDLLEERLAAGGPRPRFIYALPNFQNPSGVTLNLERRQRLLELAYRHRTPILEDDPYGELRYDGEVLPSIKSMDVEGSVIYLGTFSKILAPGLRLGWVVADEAVIQQLTRLKQGVDLHTDSLSQRIACQVSRNGWLERQIEMVKPVYRERRDAMLRALERYLPGGTTWTRPLGGLFVWATLPDGIDTAAMLGDALDRKVAYVPGVAFHPHRDRNNGMRLNFSATDAKTIEEGVRRLGEVAALHAPAKELASLPAARTM
jgi:2-aminoadipate transaminase